MEEEHIMQTRKCERCGTSFEIDFTKEKELGYEIRWCSDECGEKFVKKNCGKCDKVFYTHRNKRYCSDKCKIDVCSVCGKNYIKKTNETYCSKECEDKKYTHICKACGKEFYKRVANVVFCSDSCRKANSSVAKHYYVCKNCHTTFFTYMPNNPEYCSGKCREESVKEYRKKRGIKTEECTEEMLMDVIADRVKIVLYPRQEFIKNIQSNIDYYKIKFPEHLKEKVRQRDEYKCFICETDIDLHVHHLIPRIMGGAHAEDNLITLCSKCHRYVETGNEDHAIKKCFLNAKKKFGIIDWTIKEKTDNKMKFANIEAELCIVFKALEEISSCELEEAKIKLTNLIDLAQEYREAYQ